jgi:L-cysteine desulfidase
MMKKEQMLSLLKKDVVPALGCTEPVCVALCAAHAAVHLTAPVRKISVSVNSGIFKKAYRNSKTVTIKH